VHVPERVWKRAGLLRDRVGHGRIRVARVRHAEPGGQVDIDVAIDVADVCARAFRPEDRAIGPDSGDIR
jgi:hypothetical protein